MVAPARRAALRVLQAVARAGGDLAAAIERERRPLADLRDRALLAELSLGTLRWRAQLDHVIAWAGHRDITAFDPAVVDILRLGTYQILHLTRVPVSAAVDDAVSQAREEGHGRATSAVNAILRGIARRRGSLPLPGPELAREHLSITQSHPAWLVDRWLERLGPERASAWVGFNNTPAPVVVRAQTWAHTRDQVAEWLAARGIATSPARFAPDGLVLAEGAALAAVDDAAPRLAIQDESSQLVAAFVDARPGERVLDSCASPGGKTMAFAGAVAPGGLVVAGDLRPRRVRLLRERLAAADAPGVCVVRADTTAAPPFGPVFDAVVVDAPCTGLATIRRDPDIRWRRTAADLHEAAAVQGRMLAAAAAAVRPGGRLVYATCSSEPEENEQVIDGFLSTHPQWTFGNDAARRARLPEGVQACLDARGHLAPTPDAHGLEPFFACCLCAPA